MAKKRRWGRIETLVPGEKYRIWWPVPPDPETGKRERPTEVVYGTYEDADVALARKRVEAKGADMGTTWSQYWDRDILPSMDGLAPRTRSDYIYYFERFLRPEIGSLPVSKTDGKLACRVMEGVDPPYAWHYTYALWKKMCNMAVYDKLIPSNPVNRFIPRKAVEKRRGHELLAEDAFPYILGTRGSRYLFLAICSPIGGLRPEEVYALCSWDLTRLGAYAAADIYKTVTVVDHKKVFALKTKTEFSRRRMLFAEPFASMLLEAASECDGPLFPGPKPSGKTPNATWFANPDRIRRNWQGWCDRHGMDYVRPGDMRTIYSDWQSEAGTPDSLVEMSMGHKHASTRGRNYMNWSRRDAENVASSLAAYLKSRARCANLLAPENDADFGISAHFGTQIPKDSQFMAGLSSDF